MVSFLFRWYLRVMKKRPVLTQCVTAGVLGVCGDGISQKVVERRSWVEYDVARGLRFLAITGFYCVRISFELSLRKAPVLVWWFRVLERVPGHPKTVPLKRLFLDQTTMAPVFNASILFNLRLMEGESASESYSSLKRDFLGIWIPSLMYWPFIQMANFYMVPLNYRVIVVQVAALFWNTFLSYRMQSSSKLSMTPALEKVVQ
ncbi:unnamed protein product [Anisakis simplex]|uniref:Mitochondrial inner membrane protein Mpv17 n=1 Tax=Anisakis simplex TaxID=6269 RepID=A0A0M3K4C7_ANISI|nr:unnamed protein product [Anisakis simplex]